MWRRAIVLLALLGQTLPPIACARRCTAAAPKAAPAEPCCPACCDEEPAGEEEAPPPSRGGPHAPCCPANPERHLVAWAHVTPEATLAAPAASADVLPDLVPVAFSFPPCFASPDPAGDGRHVPLRC